MLRNQKGVTIVALAITVIVLLILSSIGVNVGLESVRKARYYNAVAQMRAMQTKVNEIYDDYKGRVGNVYGEEIDSIGNKEQAKLAYNAVKSENLTESDIGDFDEYRFFSTEYIKEKLDLDGIDYNFIVNIESRTAILIDGIKFEDKTYYALCQIEGEKYNIEYLREAEYAETGLILHYDAIKNTKIGHNQEASKWEDLSGNDNDATLVGFENTEESGWIEDGLVCNGEENLFRTNNLNLEANSDITISITFTENKFVSLVGSKYNILSADSIWRAFNFHTWYDSTTTKMSDGRIYIGGNYAEGGENSRFYPNEMKGYKTQEGKTDNIAYTYDKKTKQACLYINGKLITSKVYVKAPEGITYLQSGMGNYKTYHSILVYNRVLNGYEIQKNYETENKKYDIEYIE